MISTATPTKLLSRRAVCETLGVSLSSIKLLLGRGELRDVRIGRRSLIPVSEVERIVAERLSQASEGTR